MRTPKIYSLYALIDFLNNKNSQLNLVKLPLCSKPLNEDAWLTGYDWIYGHFSVRTTYTGKYPKIECKFELSQSQNNHLGNSNELFLNEIAKFLNVSCRALILQAIKL